MHPINSGVILKYHKLVVDGPFLDEKLMGLFASENDCESITFCPQYNQNRLKYQWFGMKVV